MAENWMVEQAGAMVALAVGVELGYGSDDDMRSVRRMIEDTYARADAQPEGWTLERSTVAGVDRPYGTQQPEVLRYEHVTFGAGERERIIEAAIRYIDIAVGSRDHR